MTTDGADARWMRTALGLARRGLGHVWPNPAVGCVLVRDGRVVGRGWTQPGGRPHAETEALAQAGAGARGATAYVTLEPCAHTGQTGPCAVALADAGIARTVIALEDPDPRVAGKGVRILRAAGVAVDTGCLAADAADINAGYLRRVTGSRPEMTLKLAMSLDGRIALGSGESRWITGPAARTHVHAMRASHDAVMIGAGTARADDPMLDVRDMGPLPRQPVRIVVDPGLSLPLTGRLARSASKQPVWLIHGPGYDRGRARLLEDLDVRLIEVPRLIDGRLDLAHGLAALGDTGLTRVFCEGGGTLAATLISEGLADRLEIFGAGKVIGGDGIPGIAGFGASDLALVPRFRLQSVRRIGDDVLGRWINDATRVRTA